MTKPARQLKLRSVQTLPVGLLILLPLFLLLGLDSFGNSETVFKFIGIQSYNLILPGLLLLLIIRWKWKFFLGQKTNLFLYSALFIGVVTTTTLAIYDTLTHANAAFALTRLNQSNLWLLTITIGLVLFLTKSKKWWHNHWRLVLFLAPFIFYYIAIITRLFPFDVFLKLVKEDGLVEYGQFWVLMMGGIVNLFLVYRLKNRQDFIFATLFLGAALVFLLIAGDEISWGQRLLGVETGEVIKQLNNQQEITFHNLYAVEWLVLYGYLTLSTIGVFGRYVCRKITPLRKILVFTPSHFLLGYFIFPFIFFLLQLLVKGGIWHPWAEVAELYFYAGLVLWTIMFGFKLLRVTPKITWRKLANLAPTHPRQTHCP